MDDASIDLILTSPPYDNLRAYAAGSAFDFPGVADQCKRLLKPGGVLVWVVGDQTINGSESGTSFVHALHFKSIGLNLHDTMIWRKLTPMPCGSTSRYTSAFEFMFVLSKGSPKTVNRIMEPCKRAGVVNQGSGFIRSGGIPRRRTSLGKPIKVEKPRHNVWDYANCQDSYIEHPAVFPLQLATDHILSWSNPGDSVLDPFAGSGTTLEACLSTDRNGIGIDISPEYLAIAERRIAAIHSATPLLA